MKITPIDFEISDEHMIDGPPRSVGLHLSQIIRDMAIRSKILQSPSTPDGNDIKNWVRMAMGVAWEKWVVTKHQDVLHQPGEMCVDGIYLTPDGFTSTGSGLINEFKVTWKSMNREKDLINEWLWMSQIQSYCYAYGVTRAMLHVYWVNGDYRNSGPKYKLYLLDFTKMEIFENWTAVLMHKKRIKT